MHLGAHAVPATHSGNARTVPAPACATAHLGIAARRPTILVLPFDLFDYSLDRRAATVGPLHRWVAHLAGHISRDLNADRALNVLAPGSGTTVTLSIPSGAAEESPAD